ncbi:MULTISPECIES: respiratory nitrate reductase subunit gamma [unclassified Cryobacterium]|uniref:respiratory nitrate reductase subunit gamma n=1 Tax=unclassified Cryobacterium TaxID=2649013 RepID=UPI000CE2D856|nr:MULTISPECIES: respiratory nitrate reductase subunit gamma [unclassified Cryobacterium]
MLVLVLVLEFAVIAYHFFGLVIPMIKTLAARMSQDFCHLNALLVGGGPVLDSELYPRRMLLFTIRPFTRLVRAFTAPLHYLFRPYIVYRTRDTVPRAVRPIRRV